MNQSVRKWSSAFSTSSKVTAAAMICVGISACGAVKVDGEAEQERIEFLYEEAINGGRYGEAMCLQWGDGPLSPQPGKFCACQTRIENTAFPDRVGERNSFFKRVLEGYDNIENSAQDDGFTPYLESVFLQMQSRIDNLEKLINPSAFDETINQKVEKQCARYSGK